MEAEGRASPAAAAAACSHPGAACSSASPAWSSPAGCVSPCKDVDGMIARLQPQMGNEEDLHHEARGSWRMASPQGPSNARGPDVRTCVFQSSGLLESGKLMHGMLVLKGALVLSLLLQALMQKAAPSL